MKKILLSLLLLLAVILFFPISNLIGLTGKNEPIPVVSERTDSFVKVSQILQNKCVDCHSPGMLRKPFYSEFPIAKQLMAKDVDEAGARLILSKKLYNGEESFSPVMLARLESVVQNGSMPPTQNRPGAVNPPIS